MSDDLSFLLTNLSTLCDDAWVAAGISLGALGLKQIQDVPGPMQNALNTDVIGMDCVTNQVTPKWDHANLLPQFRTQLGGFRVGGDFPALVANFLDERYCPGGIVMGNVIAYFLKVKFRNHGE